MLHYAHLLVANLVCVLFGTEQVVYWVYQSQLRLEIRLTTAVRPSKSCCLLYLEVTVN